MAQAIARNSSLELEVSYGTVKRSIPYSDLLKAFPDLDAEKTYITTHFKLDRPYQWQSVK